MNRDAVLLHQVHPVKLAIDGAAAVYSAVLLWRHRLGPALMLHFGLPVLGSAAVILWGDIERLRSTRRGQYVLAHMPPAAQAVRLAGDVVMAYGSWHRRPRVIVVGLGIVAAGWSAGVVPGPTTGSLT